MSDSDTSTTEESEHLNSDNESQGGEAQELTQDPQPPAAAQPVDPGAQPPAAEDQEEVSPAGPAGPDDSVLDTPGRPIAESTVQGLVVDDSSPEAPPRPQFRPETPTLQPPVAVIEPTPPPPDPPVVYPVVPVVPPSTPDERTATMTTALTQYYSEDDIEQASKLTLRVSFEVTVQEGTPPVPTAKTQRLSVILSCDPANQSSVEGLFDLRKKICADLEQCYKRTKEILEHVRTEQAKRPKPAQPLDQIRMLELKHLLQRYYEYHKVVTGYESQIMELLDDVSLTDFLNLIQPQTSKYQDLFTIARNTLKKLYDGDAANESGAKEDTGAGTTFIGSTTLGEDVSKSIADALTASQASRVDQKLVDMIEWSEETRKYKRFKDGFHNLVGKYDSISMEKKFLYLKKVVPKRVWETINTFDRDNTGYKELWEYFDRLYGRDRDAIRAQEQELKNLPHVYKNKSNSYDDEKFAEHVSKAKVAVKALAKLGKIGKDNHEQWISWMTPRVDNDLAAPFLEEYSSNNYWEGKPTIDPVDQYLEYLEKKQLAYHDQKANRQINAPVRKTAPTRSSSSTTRGRAMTSRGRAREWTRGNGGRRPGSAPVFQNYAATNTGSSSVASQPLPSCLFCGKDNHDSTRCKNRGDLSKGFEKAYQSRACVICLQGLHKSSSCPRRRPCGVQQCTQMHHPNLHGCTFVSWFDWNRRQQNQGSGQPQQAARGNTGGRGQQRGRGGRGGGRGRGRGQGPSQQHQAFHAQQDANPAQANST